MTPLTEKVISNKSPIKIQVLPKYCLLNPVPVSVVFTYPVKTSENISEKLTFSYLLIRKDVCFLMFSGGMENDQRHEMG